MFVRRLSRSKGGPPSESTGLRAAADWCRAAIVLFAIGCAAYPDGGRFAAKRRVARSRIAALRLDAVAYEHGNGQLKDGLRAAALYCQAAKLGDAASQFDLGWMYANGRGVQRDDALAAYFFQSAAAQGLQQASAMLKRVGEPGAEIPECMRDPSSWWRRADAAWWRSRLSCRSRRRDRSSIWSPSWRRSTRCRRGWCWRSSKPNPISTGLRVSPKNAQGLMQLIPETAQRFGVKNAFDPAQNMRGGIAYLRWLLAYFEGDVALVAAAYNAGERAVERHLRRAAVPRDPRLRAPHPRGGSADDAVRCQRRRTVAAVALDSRAAAREVSACRAVRRARGRFPDNARWPFGRLFRL